MNSAIFHALIARLLNVTLYHPMNSAIFHALIARLLNVTYYAAKAYTAFFSHSRPSSS